MKNVNIRGFLSESSKIKRYIDADGLRDKEFNSLKSLKEYYNITDLKKTDRTEWAISGRGTQYTWFIYTASLPETN